MKVFELLGLDDEAAPAVVKERWRALAAEHHPDHGGDAAKFAALHDAYEKALALAQEPKPCVVCKGAGYIVCSHGFSSVRMTCSVCGGSK